MKAVPRLNCRNIPEVVFAHCLPGCANGRHRSRPRRLVSNARHRQYAHLYKPESSMSFHTTGRTTACFLLSGVLVMFLLSAHCSAFAQDVLRIPTTAPNNGQPFVEGVLTRPVDPQVDKPYPAVVLLHAGGGWEVPVTGQYAKALNQAGFATLELRLFRSEAERAPTRMGYLQNLYDALRFLGTQQNINPDRVSVAGFSFGGILALTSATSWAYERFGRGTGPQFAAHAPFYPVCYGYAAFAKAKRATADLPSDFLAKWTGAPVRIFAAGQDDYDDRDPKVCEEFVSL